KALDSSAVLKPAYCRMVHGRPAYMVAWGPRRNGSKPGNVSTKDKSFRSCFVYRGWTVSPSGVTQFKPDRSLPGADLAAAFLQASRLEEFRNSLMGHSPVRTAHRGILIHDALCISHTVRSALPPEACCPLAGQEGYRPS